MVKEITMPRLSETMVDGKVLSWHKKVNDRVNTGETLAEVETDKANMEVDAVDSGILTEILIKEGQSAKVGEPIAILDGKSKIENMQEEIAKPDAVINPPEEKPETVKSEYKPKNEPQKIPTGIKASPIAKNLAEKMNINILDVKGTGPGGRIREQDIQDYARESKNNGETLTATNIQQLTRMRKTIAQRMTQSKQNIPHFYLTNEINADKLIGFYEKIADKNKSITLNDIFIKAIVINLQKYPVFNASFISDHIETHEKINIGIAFAVEEGLLVPVVQDCANKTLKEISSATRIIKDRVKNDKLKTEDMTGGTFTVSNLGMYEVKEFCAIINPPEVAGLAIGSVIKAPVVKDDQIAIGNILNLTLSADHRVVDGAEAAIFMKDLKNILENPDQIK